MAANLGKLFGEGSAARQMLVYVVLGQIVGAALGPELQLLTRAVNKILPSLALSPPDLAEMVVRHIVTEAQGAAFARESGLAEADFARLVQNAGQGLAPGELAEALRRGIIPEGGTGPGSISFEQGIAESDLRDKWAGIVKQLSMIEPTPADALDALLQGQLPLDQAQALYVKFGGDPAHFQWLFNTRGSAPTPIEASDMANRGIIPWQGEGPGVVSFHQAFLEGPWRDKWEDPYRQLAIYRPPVRTIVAMIRSGAIDDATATAWFHQEGLDQATAEAMLHDAHHQKLAPVKELARSDVEALYLEGVITRDQALSMLGLLDWTADESGFILARVDAQRAKRAADQAISRIHALYVAYRISKQDAVTGLDALHVAPAQRDQLMLTWDVERALNTKDPSSGTITSAVFYGVLTVDQGMAILQSMGWSEVGAWLEISVRLHSAQGNPPAGLGELTGGK